MKDQVRELFKELDTISTTKSEIIIIDPEKKALKKLISDHGALTDTYSLPIAFEKDHVELFGSEYESSSIRLYGKYIHFLSNKKDQ